MYDKLFGLYYSLLVSVQNCQHIMSGFQIPPVQTDIQTSVSPANWTIKSVGRLYIQVERKLDGNETATDTLTPSLGKTCIYVPKKA